MWGLSYMSQSWLWLLQSQDFRVGQEKEPYIEFT